MEKALSYNNPRSLTAPYEVCCDFKDSPDDFPFIPIKAAEAI
jgi:hypothetical protein